MRVWFNIKHCRYLNRIHNCIPYMWVCYGAKRYTLIGELIGELRRATRRRAIRRRAHMWANNCNVRGKLNLITQNAIVVEFCN